MADEADGPIRYLSVSVWPPWELKSAIGRTVVQTCEAWVRTKGAEVLRDEYPERTRLHWIGPRVTTLVMEAANCEY